MDCHVSAEKYDYGTPGRSGYSITVELEASKKESFLKTMEELRASLAKYWEKHQLPEP
jgi:hypothetical protein